MSEAVTACWAPSSDVFVCPIWGGADLATEKRGPRFSGDPMGERSAISWTDSTWNPWRGCQKVSPGCAHCYMFRDQTRYGSDPNIIVRSKTTFDQPRRWKEGRRIFTCSWSDWFIPEADGWRDEAWSVIRNTPQHTYQILTKRPERIRDHLPLDWGDGYPNVWLGVSVENQRFAHRIRSLQAIPAAVRFVSAEPLLGPLDLLNKMAGVQWVIVGGESGPDFRPMEPLWVADLVTQSELEGFALWVKQDSGPRSGQQGRIPDHHFRQEFPKSEPV